MVHAHLASGESVQIAQEWSAYRSTLEAAGLFDPNVWLDVRGNHDARNIHRLPPSPHRPVLSTYRYKSNPNQQSVAASDPPSSPSEPIVLPPSVDPFEKYSVAGAHGRSGTYHHDVDTAFGSLRFVMSDQTLRPGPHRFFNFFGVLDHDQLLVHPDHQSNSRVNASFVAGHYPLFLVDHAAHCQLPDDAPASKNSSNVYSHGYFASMKAEASQLVNTISASFHGWSRMRCSLNRYLEASEPRFPLLCDHNSGKSCTSAPLAYLSGHLHDGFGDFLHARCASLSVVHVSSFL
jgi:hypothetical protein